MSWVHNVIYIKRHLLIVVIQCFSQRSLLVEVANNHSYSCGHNVIYIKRHLLIVVIQWRCQCILLVEVAKEWYNHLYWCGLKEGYFSWRWGNWSSKCWWLSIYSLKKTGSHIILDFDGPNCMLLNRTSILSLNAKHLQEEYGRNDTNYIKPMFD